jgi:glycosyltransferase involved in cell wall biosynthesis
VLVGPVHPYRGGIAHFTASLAEAAMDEAAVEVVSFSRLYPRWLYPGRSDKDPSAHAPQFRFRVSFIIDSLNPLTWKKAAEAIVSLSPSLVILQWWTTILAAPLGVLVRLLRRRGIRVVFLVHTVFPHERRSLDRWLARWVLGAGDGFVVNSDQEGGRLHRLLPRAQRISVCSLPFFTVLDTLRLGREEARRRLSIPEDARVVLFFGFVRAYKGVAYLLEALASLRSQGQRLFGLIVGEIWEDRVQLLELSRRLGLQASVRFEDRYVPNEEVGLYFSAADVFVAPYTGGAQSGPVRIAAEYGLPIVASETIAYNLAEIARGGLRVVPPRDPVALAKAIAELVRTSSGESLPQEPARAGWTRMFHALLLASGSEAERLFPAADHSRTATDPEEAAPVSGQSEL